VAPIAEEAGHEAAEVDADQVALVVGAAVGGLAVALVADR